MNKVGANRRFEQPVLEERLVRQAVSGDPDAFARLYDAYVDGIYRFILLRVGDPATAEDLTSQVFLKAWQSLRHYRQRELAFGPWLFRVARNTLIDHYRRPKRTEPLELAAATRPDPAMDVEALVERQGTAEWLWSGLRQLTAEQRELLVLKFVEGLDTREAARVMNKRPGAVRALQMRALQTLARLMESNEP